MNKKQISEELQFAYEALQEEQIVQGTKIDKAYQGQIASFGAAVTMGSLLPAIAFFSDNGAASVERQKLMKAILSVLKKAKLVSVDQNSLFNYAQTAGKECKGQIINAAIALKLAMNLYDLGRKED